MFLDGKNHSWLAINQSEFLSWASKNGIQLQNTKIASSPLGGSGVFVSEDNITDQSIALLTIPQSMIISKACIEELAEQNSNLQHLLDSLTKFERDWRTVCHPL
jgi:hypothetical protein